jgi:hypothetical protein
MTVSRRRFLGSGAALLAGQGCHRVARPAPPPTIAPTIAPAIPPSDCSLLRASGLAYGIDLNGRYTPDPPYDSRLLYSSGPVTVSSGVNACLIGKSANAILVAFRGTVADSLSDWLHDLLIAPQRRDPLPGAVHCGFHAAVMSILGGVIDAVNQLDPKSNAVYVTGHSKGGAMAAIAAFLLQQNLPDIRIARVVTFATPKVGDADFRDGYEKLVGNHVRYENYGDLIPLLPPSGVGSLSNRVAELADIPVIGPKLGVIKSIAGLAARWNYQPVGAKSYIDSLRRTVPNQDHDTQVDDFLRNLKQHPADGLSNAHGLLYGYMPVVCLTPGP